MMATNKMVILSEIETISNWKNRIYSKTNNRDEDAKKKTKSNCGKWLRKKQTYPINTKFDRSF